MDEVVCVSFVTVKQGVHEHRRMGALSVPLQHTQYREITNSIYKHQLIYAIPVEFGRKNTSMIILVYLFLNEQYNVALINHLCG